MHLQKKLHVGCDATTAKSQAYVQSPPRPATPQPQHRKIKQIALAENLRGGLRGGTRGWRLKSVCDFVTPG